VSGAGEKEKIDEAAQAVARPGAERAGRPSPGGDEGAESEPSPGSGKKLSLEPSSKLVLHSTGQKPRHLLRYRLTPGLRACYGGKIHQLTSAPRPIGAFEVVYELELRQHVLEKDAAGATLSYELRDISISFPKRLKVKTDVLERSLEKLSLEARMTPRGVLGSLEPNEQVGRRLESALENLSRTLPQLHPRFPNEPVGVGARWSQISVFPIEQKTGRQVTRAQTKITATYEVKRLVDTPRGKGIELTSSTMVEVTGATSEAGISGKGKGDGEVVILLDTGLALKQRNHVKVITRVRGHRASNTTAVNMKLTALEKIAIESPGDAKSRKTNRPRATPTATPDGGPP
jgi:hypothetical protein